MGSHTSSARGGTGDLEPRVGRGVRTLAVFASIAALAVVPYVGSLEYPLLYDDRTILDNRWLARDAGVGSVFAHDYWHGTRHERSNLYRPLTILSLAWNTRIAGTRLGLRLANVLLHAGAACLLALALAAIARLGGPRETEAEERKSGLPFAAWAGAALFAVHPLASEAVLWVVGRAEILAAGLGLAGFLLFRRAVDDERRRWWALASAGPFLLALFSKESAAAWLVLGVVWTLVSRAAGRAATTAAWIAAATGGAVFALYLGLRSAAIGASPRLPHFLDNPLVDVSVPTRIANGVILFGRYLVKMIFPWTLSVDYGYAQIPVIAPLPWGLACAVALTVTWATGFVWLRRRSPGAAFLWAFVPAAFAVTGNVVTPIGTMFAERLAYLPLAGFCGLVGLALAMIPRAAWRAGLLGILLASAATRTAARTADYKGLLALTEATAAAAPHSAKALVNLGRVRLEVQKRPAEAVAPLERAVLIWPRYVRAHDLLAKAYAAVGDPARAAEHQRRAREDAAEEDSVAP